MLERSYRWRNISDRTLARMERYSTLPDPLYILLCYIYDSLEGLIPEEMMPQVEFMKSPIDYVADLTSATVVESHEHAGQNVIRFRDIDVSLASFNLTNVYMQKQFSNLMTSFGIDPEVGHKVLTSPMLAVIRGKKNGKPCFRIHLFKEEICSSTARPWYTDKLYSEVCDNIDNIINEVVEYMKDVRVFTCKPPEVDEHELETLSAISEHTSVDKDRSQPFLSDLPATVIREVMKDQERLVRFLVAADSLARMSTTLYLDRLAFSFVDTYDHIIERNSAITQKRALNVIRKWILSPRTDLFVDVVKDSFLYCRDSIMFVFDTSNEHFIDNVIETSRLVQSANLRRLRGDAHEYVAVGLEEFKADCYKIKNKCEEVKND